MKSKLLSLSTLVAVISSALLLNSCEKQPAFDRLKDISGNYKIIKATFLKSDQVTDSVSYNNFGSLSITNCKKNSTQNCPGEYKIGDETAVSLKASYFIEQDVNILQLTLDMLPPKNGWQLFGLYDILEETDRKMVIQSKFPVTFDNELSGRVIMELTK